MSVASITNAVGSIGGVASAAQSLADLFNGGGAYWQQLRKATFSDIPFAVLSETATFGRRNVIHEYPNKETGPWIEDLGLQTNVFRVTGFLVENSLVYGGGAVFAQRDRLIEKIQGGRTGSTGATGLSDLVHPTYGNLKVNCLQAEFGSSYDKGRVIEVHFVFARGGDRLYPKAQAPTGSAVEGAATEVTSSSLLGFVTRIATAISAGAAVVKAAVSTAVKWYQTVNTLVHDVKRFWNSVSTLAGNFGRFFGGGNTGFAGTNQKAASTATVSSLLSADTVNRATITSGGNALAVAAANVSADPTTFANAAQAVVVALAASSASPADAIRLLSSLMSFSPTPVVGTSQVAAAQMTMQGACADLFRRATVAQIAISSTSYQPSSADDAAAMRDSIVGLIDGEITTAADQGEDGVYMALRTLRQAVVADLDARGSGLASVAIFDFNAPMPALTLANRIYRDASREGELVTQANPIHPAFLPLQFNALSS